MPTKVQVLERLDRWMLWVLNLSIIAEVFLNYIDSYGHIYVEGIHHGEYGVDARTLPIAIDLLLTVLAIANVFAARFNRRSPWLRRGLALAVGSTVAANVAYGAAWGITGGLLAMWAPVALFITVECGLFVWRIVADLLKEAKEEAKAQTAYHPAPKMAPWETEALEVVPNGTANEPEGKASALPLNTAAWERLNGIGLRNGSNGS